MPSATAGDNSVQHAEPVPRHPARLRDRDAARVRVLEATRAVLVITGLCGEGKREFTAGHRQFYRLRVMDDLKACAMQTRSGGGGDADGTAVANGMNNFKSADGTSGDAMTKGSGGGGGSGSGSGMGGEATTSGEQGEVGPYGDGGGGGRGAVSETRGGGEKEDTLPDGNFLSLDERGRSEIEEALFDGDSEVEKRSVSGLVVEVIARCDVDARCELWGGLMVAGGGALMGRVVDRVRGEVATRALQGYMVNVSAGRAGERASSMLPSVSTNKNRN